MPNEKRRRRITCGISLGVAIGDVEGPDLDSIALGFRDFEWWLQRKIGGTKILNSVDLRRRSYSQFWNKTTFIPKLRGHVLTLDFGKPEEADRWASTRC